MNRLMYKIILQICTGEFTGDLSIGISEHEDEQNFTSNLNEQRINLTETCYMLHNSKNSQLIYIR